jgi:DNA-binding NarL/FixJ family response regulator
MPPIDIKARFSPVELLVLEGITEGVSQADLAAKLQIDLHTVRKLASLVMAKVQATIPKA